MDPKIEVTTAPPYESDYELSTDRFKSDKFDGPSVESASDNSGSVKKISNYGQYFEPFNL